MTFSSYEIISAASAIGFLVVSLLIKKEIAELKEQLLNRHNVLSEKVHTHITECKVTRTDILRRLEDLE